LDVKPKSLTVARLVTVNLYMLFYAPTKYVVVPKIVELCQMLDTRTNTHAHKPSDTKYGDFLTHVFLFCS